MTAMTEAELIYELGWSLWRATACVGGASPWANKIEALMHDPRPGDPVIVAYTLNLDRRLLVGRLLKTTEEPYPREGDIDEEILTRPVWTIVLLNGERIRWENVEVLRLPRNNLEPEWRAEHTDEFEAHFRGSWPSTTPAGRCQVCEWEEERAAWLAREESKP